MKGCGVCRIFGFSGREPEAARRMGELLAPGGPDHFGIYEDGDVTIGHRRLSIIDLSSASNQPMCFDGLVLSYNGEVYNYKELRQELSEYAFQTQSDTEVVLKALHKWGVKALERFRGMFAIALWDTRSKELLLARDRAGVKPLYFSALDGGFVFASELKALLVHPKFQKKLDPKAAALYFALGFVPHPYGIFEGVQKVEAGGYLLYRDGQITQGRYWNLPKKRVETTFQEALQRSRELLVKSFRYRMVSDVEVGVFLSGGIDSSLLVAYLAKEHDLKTFTIGFEDERFNEAKIAKETARFFGTKHYELYFGVKELLGLLPTFATIFDEPFGDASALPTYLLAKMARSEVKVALSADGADELFGGYPGNFKNADRYWRYRLLAPLAPLMPAKRAYMATRDWWRYKLATRYRLFPHELKVEPLLDSPKCSELLECMWRFDFDYFLQDDVLVKVDRTTMANSLEAREPYLDHELIEFAWSLPPQFRRHKRILRTLLAQEVPGELSRLPKQGFSVPIKYWLRNELKEQVLDLLHSSSAMDDIVAKEAILRSFLKSGGRTNAIWLMYMFRLWEERYL